MNTRRPEFLVTSSLSGTTLRPGKVSSVYSRLGSDEAAAAVKLAHGFAGAGRYCTECKRGPTHPFHACVLCGTAPRLGADGFCPDCGWSAQLGDRPHPQTAPAGGAEATPLR